MWTWRLPVLDWPITSQHRSIGFLTVIALLCSFVQQLLCYGWTLDLAEPESGEATLPLANFCYLAGLLNCKRAGLIGIYDDVPFSRQYKWYLSCHTMLSIYTVPVAGYAATSKRWLPFHLGLHPQQATCCPPFSRLSSPAMSRHGILRWSHCIA